MGERSVRIWGRGGHWHADDTAEQQSLEIKASQKGVVAFQGESDHG